MTDLPLDNSLCDGVRALCGGTPEEQAAAAAALFRTVVDGGPTASQAVPAALADAGGIAPLVELLAGSQEEQGRLHAAVLLGSVEALPQCAPHFRSAAVARPLVRCLAARSAALQAAAAGLLANIASDAAGGAAIAAAGGASAAIQLLGSDCDVAVQHACRLLRNLADSGRERQSEVAAAGAIAPLVRLLSGGASEAVVSQATHAIASLCGPEIGHDVVAADPACAVEPALERQRSSSDGESAAQALSAALASLEADRAALWAANAGDAGGPPPAPAAGANRGCKATDGLRRCGVCGVVGYCRCGRGCSCRPVCQQRMPALTIDGYPILSPNHPLSARLPRSEACRGEHFFEHCLPKAAPQSYG